MDAVVADLRTMGDGAAAVAVVGLVVGLVVVTLLDEKKDGVLRLGRNELALGKEMDGKALESRRRASEPTDDERLWRVPDWTAAAMAEGRGTAFWVCIMGAVGARCSCRVSGGTKASKKPGPPLPPAPSIIWSMAMAFSAAGVRGDDRRVATGLITGWMNDRASSSPP